MGGNFNPLVILANQMGEKCKKFGQNIVLYDAEGNIVDKGIDEKIYESWNDILNKTKEDALMKEVGITGEIIRIIETFDVETFRKVKLSGVSVDHLTSKHGKNLVCRNHTYT